MGRPPRITEPGLAYHVLNRRVMRLPLFLKDEDYLCFERVPAKSLSRRRRAQDWHVGAGEPVPFEATEAGFV